MIAQHSAHDDLENFLEGPHSARQGDEGVSPLFEKGLSFAHAGGDDQLVAVFIGNPFIDQKLGCDAGYFSPGAASGIGQGAHAADVVAAVYEAPVLAGDCIAQFGGGAGIDAIDVTAGGAVDGD